MVTPSLACLFVSLAQSSASRSPGAAPVLEQGASLHGLFAFVLLTAVVLTAAVFDWRTEKIPNLLLGPAILAGFILAGLFGFVEGQFEGMKTGMQDATLGLLAGFIPMFLIFLAGALGGGDVKMMAALGAIAADWEVVLGTAFYGFIISAVIAVIVMIRRRIVGRTIRRIANAALLAAAKIKPDLERDSESPRIPLAIGFAIGAIVSGAEHLL